MGGVLIWRASELVRLAGGGPFQSGTAGERVLNLSDAAGELLRPCEFGCRCGEMAPGRGLAVEEGHPDRDGPQRLSCHGERYGGPFVLGQPCAESGFVGAEIG